MKRERERERDEWTGKGKVRSQVKVIHCCNVGKTKIMNKKMIKAAMIMMMRMVMVVVVVVDGYCGPITRSTI